MMNIRDKCSHTLLILFWILNVTVLCSNLNRCFLIESGYLIYFGASYNSVCCISCVSAFTFSFYISAYVAHVVREQNVLNTSVPPCAGRYLSNLLLFYLLFSDIGLNIC